MRAILTHIRLLYNKVKPLPTAIKVAKDVRKIGQKLNWNSKGIRYFGCVLDAINPSDIKFNILLVDSFNCLVEIVSGRRKRRVNAVDLDAVVDDFEDAVRNGSLVLDVDGETVYVSGVASCDPPACPNGSLPTVIAPPPPDVGNKLEPAITYQTSLATAVVIYFCQLLRAVLAAN